MKKNIRVIGYLVHILGFILVFRINAYGQTSYELSCKAQAKEVALQTYQSCVTEARQQQIDSLRQEYQEKLAELRNHYNQELKKAAGKDVKEADATATEGEGSIQLKPNTAKPKRTGAGKSETPTKGIAKTLPKKQNNNGPALPVQTVREDVKVVPSIEAEAAEMDEAIN